MKRADLDLVQHQVNEGTTYTPDQLQYGQPEYWAEARGRGDCEDYAIAKAHRLLNLGWPVEALRFGLCVTETGVLHCVLLADLGGQTWVLDNRYPHVMAYQDVPYAWSALQVAGTSRFVLPA